MPQRPISDDEVQRVSSYMLGQAEKYSWLELWPRVVAGRIEFLDSIARVTPEQAAWKPAGDDWSIAEVAQHVLDGSRRTYELVEALSQGREPNTEAQAIGAVDPEKRDAQLEWGDLRNALVEDSITFASVTRNVPEPPNLERLVAHPFFGPLHGRAWFIFQRVHDQDHARQVAAIQESDGYPQ